jgi:hypothetical protein
MVFRKATAIACLLGLALTCACVANRAYRRGPAYHQLPESVDRVPFNDADCSQSQSLSGKSTQRYYLAHIEFDDMGELRSIGNLKKRDIAESQLENALDVIRRAQNVASSEKRALIVITFVHGWHNNASPYDEINKNLGSFKTVLQDLSCREALATPGKLPVLVGVFLSWRGQAVAGDPAFTYWNRRDAAVRVGGPSMTEAVTRLIFETKGVPLFADRCALAARASKRMSYFAIIAHSFGARALEHALTQPMLSMILERQMQTRECAQDWNQAHPENRIENLSFPAPADLIVFLNAANDAFEAKQTIEALKRANINVSQKPVEEARFVTVNSAAPFMISITSDGDWATERIMPKAQFLSSFALAFRRYDPNDKCADEGQLCDHKQSYYFRHSEASITGMRSHIVLEQKTTGSCKGNPWPYFQVEGTGKCFCIDQNRYDPQDQCQKNKSPDDHVKFAVGPVWNDTPFFVMGVPKSLIPNHNQIFQNGTEELLIAISSRYQTLSGATTLTSPLAAQ